MKPRISILSKTFRYRNAANTSVAKTWAEAKKRKDRIEQEQVEKLRDIKPRIKGVVNG